MKTLTQLLTLHILLALVLICGGTALAQGNDDSLHPAVFVGAALLDRETAPDGVTVTAVIDGAEAAATTTSAGSYALRIPPHPEKNYSNKTITFTIDGHRTRQTAKWTSNGGGLLNLHASKPGPARIHRGVLGVNTVLADDQGLPLYTFDQDTPATRSLPAASACTSAECLALWAPMSTLGQPMAELDIDQDLLSTAEHPITGLQVTYNGRPLYRHRDDLTPGIANGQGSGKQWWVISTTGDPIQGAGVQGPAGQDGKNGRTGVDGNPGAPGADGKRGLPGPEGLTGEDGADGRNGWDGTDGAPGEDGITGPTGEQGLPGQNGETGPQGPPGTNGVDGVPGKDASSVLPAVALIIAAIALATGAPVTALLSYIRKRKTG